MKGQRGAIAALLAAWWLSVAGGMLLMAAYASGPGNPGAPPRRWPHGPAWPRDGHRPTLLLFLHPRCPSGGGGEGGAFPVFGCALETPRPTQEPGP